MAPPKTRKRKSDQDSAAESAVQAAASANSKRQKQLPVRAKDGDSSPIAVKADAKSTMVVFGDDDEAPAPASSAPARKTPVAATAEDEEVEDSDDDDDDAPEAVSTHKAASQVKKSAHTAQKAAQEQAAVQKRKRQERDTLFKQQAGERKKLEDEAKAQATAESDQLDDDLDAVKQSEPASGRRRMDKTNVPNVLPAEFLTDSSSEDEDEDVAATSKRPKKRQVSSIDRKLSRQDRAPRDARIGSTVYRVAKKTDERLAPKAQKYGQNARDLLLKRNRSATKPRPGFFVKN